MISRSKKTDKTRGNRSRQAGGQKPRFCFFCKEKQEPSFKQLELLRRYVSERGKILSRARTGICRQHQKGVTQEIKRARLLSLFPFVTKIR